MPAPMMSTETTSTQLVLANPARAIAGEATPNTTQPAAIRSAKTPSSKVSSTSAGKAARRTIRACQATAESPAGGGSIQPSPKITAAAPKARCPVRRRQRGRAAEARSLAPPPPRAHNRRICVVRFLRAAQHACQPSAQGGGNRERHARLLAHDIEKNTAGQTQNLAIRLGFDGGSSRAVGEKRHFPEGFSLVEDL